ncbi:MAG: ATP-binding cassette domain-containing protein [Bifidobacterium sp.]|nr:ATP-binding cassette domain-containing protein [Bifidobacterium sp.]
MIRLCCQGGDHTNVQLSHITFSYGRQRVLSDVSFDFRDGLYGLLGPNGAGKTTLMSIVTTLLRPSSGSVAIDGMDMLSGAGRRRARGSMGYLPQSFELMEASSLLHNVQYAAWAWGASWSSSRAAAEWAIEEVGLSDSRSTAVRKFSGGMRQRAGIACAIVMEPRVLVLDEPTVGFDPIRRVEIRRFLDGYAHSHIVLVSTHLVEDLVAMADQVIVLDRGRVLLRGDMDDLARYGDHSDRMSTRWESGYQRLLTGTYGAGR